MPIGDANEKGTQTLRYALADHTHKSTIQSVTLPVNASGEVIWTYPTAYLVSPVISVSAQGVEADTQPYIANIVGTPGLTSCKVRVYRARTQTLGGTLAAIINVVVNLFSRAPSNTVVHITARKPTV